jgi:hypothetical protein
MESALESAFLVNLLEDGRSQRLFRGRLLNF